MKHFNLINTDTPFSASPLPFLPFIPFLLSYFKPISIDSVCGVSIPQLHSLRRLSGPPDPLSWGTDEDNAPLSANYFLQLFPSFHSNRCLFENDLYTQLFWGSPFLMSVLSLHFPMR